jgi:hypothetical protein
MDDNVQVREAREGIERVLAPRRIRLRQTLAKLLLETDPAATSADQVLARVHDLCVKELTERMRLASHELRQAYAGAVPGLAESDLLSGIKGEVENCLSGEMADLVEDERMVAAILGRLPRFLEGKTWPAILKGLNAPQDR